MSAGHEMKGSAKPLTKLLWLLTLVLPLRAVAETVEYVHTDALGTPIAVTDASGNLIETSEYEPYGKLLNRPVTDGPGFTGHVQDAATGLTYMQQRYYDPVIGRFLSVDPVTANSVSGGNFNRYWYGNNNPYAFRDPDGRLGCTGTHIESRCVPGRMFGPPTLRAGDGIGNKLTNKPIEGQINRKNPENRTADGGFDPDGEKKLRSGGARPHKGIDIAAEPGKDVKAAGGGNVQNKNDPNGYGKYVEISHGDGYTTRYAHLSETLVKSGDSVSGGDVIGKTGTTGNLPPTADPHLHFEIRLNGVPQDPTTYFDYKYEDK